MRLDGHAVLEAHKVKVLGSGHKVVVLAHGFGCDQSVWQNIAPSLLHTYKVVLFDLACAGSISHIGFQPSLYESFHGFADNLLTILEELHIQKCSYVGHSMSGMIGCIASIKKPKLFNKLVLLCASPRYLNDGDYYGGFEREDLDDLYDAMRSDFQGWVSSFAPRVVGVHTLEAVDKFTHTFKKMNPDIAYVVARTIFETDNRGVLASVKVPCHIIQTTKDFAVPLAVAEYVHHNMNGNSTVDVLPVEGHLPQLSAPDVLMPVLMKVLSS